MVQALPPLGPLHGGFVLSGIGGEGDCEDPIAGGKRAFINKKQNKRKPPRRGKTDWLAG